MLLQACQWLPPPPIPLQTNENNEAVKTDDLDFDNLTLGVNKFADFTWRQLSDGWACTACARCQDVCPAFASLHAMIAQSHMDEYGTSREELSAVSEKNHYHASLNPMAQFPFQVSGEAVSNSGEMRKSRVKDIWRWPRIWEPNSPRPDTWWLLVV